MPRHYNKTPTGAELLSKSMQAAGWIYKDFGTAGWRYFNMTTGKSQKKLPLPKGWVHVEQNQPTHGTRPPIYQSVYGEETTEMPTVAAVPPVTDSKTSPATGSSEPGGVVSAQGLEDKSKLLLSTGGQPVLTTPFGVTGPAKVKKKKLLGA